MNKGGKAGPEDVDLAVLPAWAEIIAISNLDPETDTRQTVNAHRKVKVNRLSYHVHNTPGTAGW